MARVKLRRRVKRRKKANRLRRAASPGALAARSEAKDRSENDSGILIGGALAPAEKAADRMAAQVLSGGPVTAPTTTTANVHRKCAECENEDKATRDAAPGVRIASGKGAAAAGPKATAAIRSMGAGRPLAPTERSFFEPRFCRDFSSVRVHDDAAADHAARTVEARAFTYGNSIAFAHGEKSRGGARLMAHELAHVAQQDKPVCRVVRRADKKCDACPNPVSPKVKVKITPIIKSGTPSGSLFGSTNWGTAKMRQLSVWHRERKTCDTCDVAGNSKSRWELCPRKINALATVNIVLDRAEIRRRNRKTGEDWWTECGANPGADRFLTKAAAKAAFSDPKRKTVAGVTHHEKYHVGVSERALKARIGARNDIHALCPYKRSDISAWKTALEATIRADAAAFLQGNPSEANEEANASAAECTKY